MYPICIAVKYMYRLDIRYYILDMVYKYTIYEVYSGSP